ncbi:MAG TPA: DUF1549 domain-containing protein, partial [Planctomycetota bacterium]|nr:DUF1549 domain-containing protein [Planctomycetota bacterium]
MVAALWVLFSLQSESDADFFEKKVRPVLIERCYSCHSVSSNKHKGGLLLDSRESILKGGDSGAAAVAGDPDKTLILRAVSYSDELRMPPKGRLGGATVADLKEWIRRGLPWPHPGETEAPSSTAEKPRSLPWSFQPVRNLSSPAYDIDHFLPPTGQGSAPPARRAALLRRVTIDLIGLPPTVEELDAFLRDASPDAFERVVERLLASPHFGERFARHWMDVVRYADSTGFGADYTLDEAWKYRDYLIDAFNQDKPYDVFVREQIAGDLLTPPVPVATGFLLVGPKELAEYDKEKLRMDVVDEQLNTIGQAFLGLTFGCARCHDHKFDPIPTADYYALAGILRSTRTIPPGNLSGPISAWNRRLMDPSPGQVKALTDWKQEVERARAQLVQVRDRKAAVAEARTLERTLARLKADPRPDEEQIRRLEAELSKKKRTVAPTPADIERLEAELLRAFQRPKPEEVLAVEDEKAPADLWIHIRGDVHNRGPVAPRGFLSTIALEGCRTVDRNSSGRLQLAEWITHPDHPLTARVMVNRLWQHLMGEGLVRTVDNFGLRGEPPSNPELLDYLATRLREKRGSLKAVIREIVLSRAYQRSGRSLRRLDAEVLRDSMLAISGELDGTRGGSTMTYTGRLFVPLESIALPVDPWRRRSVYLPIYRGTTPPDLLEAFDFAPPGMVTGRRASTSVPTQALFLMNSAFVMD